MPVIEPFLGCTSVAYFSMEIALRPEVHTYSGGLGILAGDTARSCADLALPAVFVTLASRQGYLRQELDPEGRQIDSADPWRLEDWAEPLQVMVGETIEGRTVWIRPWLYTLSAQHGRRIPVLLLDTHLEQNAPEDRAITDRLYGGDEIHRLKQEIVLGVGGARILEALGFRIATYHLNEGHAAFLTLHLLRRHRRPAANGRSTRPEPAGEGERPLRYNPEPVREICVFTTHTPVEAGHDRFSYADVERVLGRGLIEIDQIRAFAGEDALNMTRLALNLSGYVNGVARRHAETTRRMFPGYRIEAITNGVHARSWTHPAVVRLLEGLLPQWEQEPELLSRADMLDSQALWQAHQEAKGELLALIARCGSGPAREAFDPDRLTLGFARRMTGYKRPDLIFSDIERLRALNSRHPLQLVMAGKAHPRDQNGKDAIAAIHRHIGELAPELPVVFLPNYDMAIARVLVAGVDLWLNTPQPPLEASGTSGMKVALNGGLNLSVLDGWWVEACIEDVTGWAIGRDHGQLGPETGEPGAVEDHAQQLYEKLEGRILPLYYDDRERWIWMMKQAIAKVGSYFTSQRMMQRYASDAYLR